MAAKKTRKGNAVPHLRKKGIARTGGSPGEEAVPHLRKKGTTKQLIVDGEPFIMLAGELHNSSASSLEYMVPIWPRLAGLNLNTVLATASWELVEPAEGRFEFDLIDGLIEAARRHGLKLVLLWFGTWKNAVSTYAPAWVKRDLARFERAQCRPGQDSGAISCLSQAACRADSRAFAALMRHIRKVDGRRHTVLMVQVENETGLLGAARDHCPLAEEQFRRPVPAGLGRRLEARADALMPDLRRCWRAAGCRTEGTWPEVFGEAADEVFMAWHVAKFVDCVAAAGKAEYAIPMYANAWLVGHDGQEPGRYPSGGPVARMMDVWQAAAPQIDLLAPDIYRDDFAAVCAEYARSDNPLMIPEAHRDDRSAATVFLALGRHDAMCFAPFGIDSVTAEHPLGRSYKLLGGMIPILARYQGTGQMVGVLQEGGNTPQELDLGGYLLTVEFPQPPGKGSGPGAGIIIMTDPGQYIVAGKDLRIRFRARPGAAANVEFLWLEEGRFEDGKWRPLRRLNGDEFYGGLILGPEPAARIARLYSYA